MKNYIRIVVFNKARETLCDKIVDDIIDANNIVENAKIEFPHANIQVYQRKGNFKKEMGV